MFYFCGIGQEGWADERMGKRCFWEDCGRSGLKLQRYDSLEHIDIEFSRGILPAIDYLRSGKFGGLITL